MSRASGAVPAPPQPLTKAEVAAVMRCSPKTVQRRVAAGRLACIRDGAGRPLFLPEFITDYFERNTSNAQSQASKPKRNPKYA